MNSNLQPDEWSGETNPRRGRPSASSMRRVAACPGSAALERVCPSTDTADSLRGTQGHAALAGEDTELDGQMEVTVEMCEDIVKRIKERTGFEGIEPMKEVRLWWEQSFSGQLDQLFIQGHNALVVDFKMLYGEHDEAKKNWQLRTQALLAANTYNLSHVLVALVQPRVKGQFTLADYDMLELKRAHQAILAAVAASDAPNAQRKPGPHCKFCRGLSICPEANAEASEAVILAEHPKLLAERTPAERGQMLDWIEYAEMVIEQRKKELKAMLIADPSSVTGWHMAQGSERRVVPNNAKLFFAMKDAIGLEMGEFLAACKVTLGILSRIHKEKTMAKGKVQTKAFDRLIEPYVVKVQNAPSLERIS